ncbi:type II toxin-antitoxin system HicB family antitoxin [Endothiovibrio diazotrophicus]
MSHSTMQYTYWQDDGMWLGYLDEFPDYMTQGESEEALKEILLDLYKDLTGGAIPAVRHHGELDVA